MQLTLADHLSGQIQEETDISPTLAANLRRAVDGMTKGKVTFSVLVLPHSGPRSAESKIGADLAIVLRVRLPTIGYQKALLFQAKNYTLGKRLDQREVKRLERQCRHMLGITQSSYIMLYEEAGISVTDAAVIHHSARESLASRTTLDLRRVSYYKPFDGFMQDVFKTFGGDRELGAQVKDLRSLRSFAERVRAANAVAVIARSINERSVALHG